MKRISIYYDLHNNELFLAIKDNHCANSLSYSIYTLISSRNGIHIGCPEFDFKDNSIFIGYL